MEINKNDAYRFCFSREVEFSGILSGCCYHGDSVPGVSASLQPPATFCDRCAIKIIDPNVTISLTKIVTRVACHLTVKPMLRRDSEVRHSLIDEIHQRQCVDFGCNLQACLVQVHLLLQTHDGCGRVGRFKIVCGLS